MKDMIEKIKIIGKKIIYIFIIFMLIIATISYIKDGIEINNKNKKEIKEHPYVGNIREKYPEFQENIGEILESIKNNIIRKEIKEFKDGSYEIKYYDSKNRVIYKIYDKNEIYSVKTRRVKNGGRRSSFIDYRGDRYYSENDKGTGEGCFIVIYPNEEGVVYDENGKIKLKIIINQDINDDYKIKNGKDISIRENVFNSENREDLNNYYKRNGVKLFRIELIKYKYLDKNRYETVTYETTGLNNMIEITKKNYEFGEIKKEEKLIDNEINPDNYESRILTYINTEYSNSKIIKRRIERKNKYNNMTSIIKIDPVRKTIENKYYKNNKVYATVTTDVINNISCIVKREKIGSNFIIWDMYKINKDKYEELKDYHTIYIENKNTNKIEYRIKESCKKSIFNNNLRYMINEEVDNEEYLYNYHNTYIGRYRREIFNYMGKCEVIEKIIENKIEGYSLIPKIENEVNEIITDDMLKLLVIGKGIEKYREEKSQLIYIREEKIKNINKIKEKFIEEMKKEDTEITSEIWNEIQVIEKENK